MHNQMDYPASRTYHRAFVEKELEYSDTALPSERALWAELALQQQEISWLKDRMNEFIGMQAARQYIQKEPPPKTGGMGGVSFKGFDL